MLSENLFMALKFGGDEEKVLEFLPTACPLKMFGHFHLQSKRKRQEKHTLTHTQRWIDDYRSYHIVQQKQTLAGTGMAWLS